MNKIYILHHWIKNSDAYKVFSYEPLHNKLRTEYNGVNYSEGLWFLYTDKTAEEITKDIEPLVYNDTPLPEGEHISHRDIYFICEMGKDYGGWFFTKGFNWIKEHQ